MARLIRYLENNEWKYASVKESGDLSKLLTVNKSDLVSAINELFSGGGAGSVPDDLVERLEQIEANADLQQAQINDSLVVVGSNSQALSDMQVFQEQLRLNQVDFDVIQTDLQAKTNQAVADIILKADLEYVNGELTKKIDTTQHELKYQEVTGQLLDKVNIETYQEEYDSILSELTGKVSSLDFDNLQGKVSTVENEITNIEGELSTRVTQRDFDDAVGVNQWVASKYNVVGTDLSQTPPSFPLISGMVASETKDFEDSVNLIAFTGDDIITHLFTNVKLEVAKTISLDIQFDDSLAVYMNGAKIYENKYSGTNTINVSLSLRAGWNTIEFLHGNKTGASILDVGVAISTQVDKMTTVIGVGDKNETRFAQAETLIKQTSEAIELKASKTDVTDIGNKVTANEASISVLSGEIESKVSSTDFNAYSQRVSDAESRITQTETDITSKVSQTDYNLLNGKVDTHATEIEQLGTSINLKASQSELDTVTGRVGTAEGQISLNTNAINLKATKEELNTLDGRLTTAEGSLTVANDEIALRVSKTEYNTKVGELNTAITTAQNSATTANTLLGDIASDSKLTPVEKNMVKKEWDIIVSEKTTIDAEATTYGVTTEKTNYGTAYTALSTYITPLLSSLTDTSTIVGTDFRAKFKDYYDKKVLLLKKTSELAKSLADGAQTTANTAVTNASNAQTTANNAVTSATTANNLIGDIANDNKLTAVEKKATKKEWDVIVGEKTNIESQATTYAITTEKTTYTNAYNALNTYVTPLLTDLNATSTIVGTDFRAKFKTYYDAKTALLKKVAENAKTLADNAQTSANTANSGLSSLATRVTATETSITQTSTDIALKADKATTYSISQVDGKVGELDLKITNANTAITQNADEINLRAVKTDVYTKVEANSLLGNKANTSDLNALVTRVSTAETNINQTSNDITLKANATDVYTKAETNTELNKKANQTDMTAITNSVSDMSSDLKVTSVEKIALKTDWERIKAEYAQVLANAQVATVAVSTTAFTNAYNAFNGTTPKIEAEVLLTMNTTYTFGSTTLRDAFRTKFNTYFTELEKIRKAINDKVNSTANTANSTANTANSTANTANGTANALRDTTIPALVTRVSTAEGQLTVANDAITQRVTKTDYETDMSGVNTRLSTAEASITTQAGQINLKATASEVYTKTETNTELNKKANQSDLTTAQNSINDMMSDLKVTPIEKAELARLWHRIQQEYTQLSTQATALSVSKTTYDSAYNALNTTAPRIQTDILANMTTTYTFTTTTRDAFKTQLNTYLTEAEAIGKALTDKIQSNASTAQTTANTAVTNAQTAQNSANTANNVLADIASDSKLTAGDKNAVKKEWDIIVGEKANVESQGTTYAITTEKTTYVNAYNALNTYITPLLSSMTTTSDIVGTTFRTNFKTYYDAKTALLKLVAEKAKTLADNAQGTANTANSTANTLRDTTVPALTGRVTTAETKITPDAIVSTVTASTPWTTQATAITQQSDKISLVVGSDNKIKSQEIASAISLTPNAISLISNNIDLTGKVTFNSFDTTTKTSIANNGDAINQNPYFIDWTGTFPTGYSSASGTTPTKVTETGQKGNMVRFVVGAGTSNYLNPTSVTNYPYFQYVTVQATFRLESGTIDGAGVLFRYNATANVDHKIHFKDLVSSPVLNKWYTVTKVIKQTASPSGFTGYAVFPMGSWSSFGTVTAKTVTFSEMISRPATEQEINAYEVLATVNANESTWGRAGNINSDGTFNTAKLSGTVAESQIISTATAKWNTAKTATDDMLSDLKVTPIEKAELARMWHRIQQEYTQLSSQATALGVTKTTYDSAYNALNTTTPRIQLDILASMTSTYTFTTTTRDTFKTQVNTYYTEAEKISKALTDKIQANANTALNAIADMSSDGKITPVEKVQLKKEWATMVAEKTSLEANATTFGITTDKTNYVNAYNTLNTVLNGSGGILTSMTTTSDVTGATFRGQFDDYYDKKAILQKNITETARTLANNAQGTANTANSTANTANSTANAAKADTDRWKMSGKTTINGGQIETDTILVGALKAGTIDVDKMTISNSKVTINSAGVTVKDGDFVMESSGGDARFTLNPRENMLKDHSFEMLKPNWASPASPQGFQIDTSTIGTSTTFHGWYKIGSPLLDTVWQTDRNPAEFMGYNAVLCSSVNYVAQMIPVKPSTTYTLSAHARPPFSGTPGKVRFYYQAWNDAGTSLGTWSKTFGAPSGDWKRYSYTFTVPSTASYMRILLYSADTNWIIYDGVQLVEGDMASPYEGESYLWKFMNAQVLPNYLETKDGIGLPYANSSATGLMFPFQNALTHADNTFTMYANRNYGDSFRIRSHADSSSYRNDLIIDSSGNTTFSGSVRTNTVTTSSGNLVIGTASGGLVRMAPAGSTIADFDYGNGSRRLRLGWHGYLKIVDSTSDFEFRNGGDTGWATVKGIWSAQSERGAKKRIKKVEGRYLDRVKSANTYEYLYKDEDESRKQRLGLIVDEVPDEIKTEQGDAVDIYAMTSYLWKAVQELSEQVEYLEQKIKRR